jgi:hypothetical protein
MPLIPAVVILETPAKAGERHPRKYRARPFVFIGVVASGLAKQHD